MIHMGLLNANKLIKAYYYVLEDQGYKLVQYTIHPKIMNTVYESWEVKTEPVHHNNKLGLFLEN